ncbi:MAG TPA: L,D-transpeptidase [Pyrinomonadaceae bacterium]|nr:L,D-transpeptidase [Pyrinomonadaceae bacterium]
MAVTSGLQGGCGMRRVLLTIWAAIALLSVVGCGAGRQARATLASEARPAPVLAPSAEAASAPPASQAARRAPLKLPLAAPRVLVSKRLRRLTLYDGERELRRYTIALGLSPEADKERQGDNRTPEGEFYVFTKNPRSAFYLSLGLSYPNAEDAERGLRAGLITRAQHRRILRAMARKAAPPRDTALGGDIYLHGGGTGRDWTWGCVALDNADIKELYDAVPVGTTVRIEH